MGAMKRARVPKSLAPAPRLTPWVPGLVSVGLSALWLLALWAL
jgi:hypothetical protein